LTSDGEYEKIDKRGKLAMSCQEEFCKEAVEAAAVTIEATNGRVFVPEEHVER